MDFKIGDRVRKIVGFAFTGTIRSDYTTGAGKRRFDVEHDDGWLHVHNPEHIVHDHPEFQYLDLLRDCRNNGSFREGRNGGTYSLFGRQIRFDLSKGFPLLTTKFVPFKVMAEELFWFLSGNTNNKALNDKGVTIWDEWAAEDGSLGPIYGKQWRMWDDTDQIDDLIGRLMNDPYSRRHVISAWNVSELPDMALPPCHCLFQFYVRDGKLDCQLYQRSADIFLGVPFNIASYALLTHLVAKAVGLEVGDFVHTFGDVHLYANHLEQADLQLSRLPTTPFPTLEITCSDDTPIFDVTFDDLKLHGYQHQGKIAAPVSA